MSLTQELGKRGHFSKVSAWAQGIISPVTPVTHVLKGGYMSKGTSYRLGRFEIIEKKNDEIWWETHAGFGRFRAGKCFIVGEVLFIAPYQTEEPGFLKGEFIEQLNKYPKWEKTKYYCSSYFIYNCKTGRMSRNFGAGEDLESKTKNKNDFGNKEKFYEKPTAKPINFIKGIVKFKEKGVVIWGLLKDRFL